MRYDAGSAAADAAIKRFGVQGFPTLLALSAKGEELDELGPGSPKDLLEGLEQVRAGKDTLPALRAKLLRRPKDTAFAIKLAERLSNRYPDEALEIATKALQLMDPTEKEPYAHALFILGYTQANRGESEQALGHYERIVREFPGTKTCRQVGVFATNFLGEIEPARALAFLAEVTPLSDPEHRGSLEHTRGYLYLKAAEAAWLERGKQALKDGHAEWLNVVAHECYLRNWHTKEATVWAREAVALSKGAPHILDTLAHLLARDGALGEAVEIQRAALEKASDAELRAEILRGLVTFEALQKLKQKTDGDGAAATGMKNK